MAEIVDRNIGSLPAGADIQDDTLMVGEQQGEAVKLTGAQWKSYAQSAFNASYNKIVSDVLAALPVYNGEVTAV